MRPASRPLVLTCLGLLIGAGSVAAQGRTSQLELVILGEADGFPIPNVAVAFPSLQKAASTDTAGRVTLRNLKAGTHEMITRRIGYATLRKSFVFTAGQTVTDTVRLATINVLDSVVVRAAPISSFEEHRLIGLGKFLDRSQLEKMGERKLSSVIGEFAGAGIIPGRGNHAWLVNTRGVRTLNPKNCGIDDNRRSSGSSRGGIDPGDAAMGAKPCACYAQVWLDRTMIYRASGTPGELLFNLNSIAVDQIEAVEYFAGPAQTPLEYSMLNSSCGVLVIHTRRPRE
jgi:hypothetical protein